MEFMGSFTKKNVKKKEIKHITNRCTGFFYPAALRKNQ